MSENISRAMWPLLATVIVTFAVSLFTKPKPVSKLEGPVYGPRTCRRILGTRL